MSDYTFGSLCVWPCACKRAGGGTGWSGIAGLGLAFSSRLGTLSTASTASTTSTCPNWSSRTAQCFGHVGGSINSVSKCSLDVA